ncbi:hypothetical protein CL633_01735 [bacterium]|nr:hypothetical protein [bacterium]|tara:strand:+ start:1537 stop:2304 length:768 start_codon:yes stop_codon:yes gene_type:complete
MQNSDLIKKLQKLKSIQPSRAWLFNNREKLANQIPEDLWKVPGWSMAVLSLVLVVGTASLMIGIVGAAQNSLPGEVLHSLKIVSEKAQVSFVSQNKKAQLEVKFVENRVEELNQVLNNEKEPKKKVSKAREVSKKITQYKKELEQAKEEIPELAVDQVMEQAQEVSDQTLKIVASVNSDENGLELQNTQEISTEEIIARIQADLEEKEAELGEEALKQARLYFESGDYVLVLELLTNLENYDIITNIEKLEEAKE